MMHGMEALIVMAVLAAAQTPPPESPPRGPNRLGAPEVYVQERSVVIGGSEVHYLESGPREAPVLLLLHGGRFTSETWRDLGTINRFAISSVRVVAVDLPGFGRSPGTTVAPNEFLARFIEELDLKRPVVVSPSMSGRFSLPLMALRPELVGGFVPVAPVAIDVFAARLAGSEVPTLIVWGENDYSMPLSEADKLSEAFVNSRLLVVPGASHPCYLDEPELFHAELLAFIRELFRRPIPAG
jgi:pimeloyl-ACP methyl ester carboxylesterase